MSDFLPSIPLLVPSFSSKGNLLIPHHDRIISDNYSLLQTLDTRISSAYLISAYDAYYGLMPENPESWPYSKYLFVDSGGYETSNSFDTAERNKFNYKTFSWDAASMKSLYAKVASCPNFSNSNIVLSTFDCTESLDEQLDAACQLADTFKDATIDFLVKLNCPLSDLWEFISDHGRDITRFKIIGFTEKQLGSTVQQRIKNLLEIRGCLTACGWDGYIHIFGGLEPALIRLYYYAGGDLLLDVNPLFGKRITVEKGRTKPSPIRDSNKNQSRTV